MQIPKEKFESILEHSISELPDFVHQRLDNIIFVVEDYPDDYTINKMRIHNRYSLLGLYSGVPFPHRRGYYSGALPDTITLFQKNIESLCRNELELIEKIKEVLIHEVGHYLGMSEKEIRKQGY